MASPQIENGYTRISNELLEAMSCSKEIHLQERIIFWVLRNTYGVYDRKKKGSRTTCRFTWTGIGEAIKARRDRISSMGRWMLQKKILRIDSGGNIGLQKDHEQWIKTRKVGPQFGGPPKWGTKTRKVGGGPAQSGGASPREPVSYRNVVERVKRGTTAPSLTLPNGQPDTLQSRADLADYKFQLEDHPAWSRLPFKRQDELAADWRTAESNHEAARIKHEHDELRKKGLLPP